MTSHPVTHTRDPITGPTASGASGAPGHGGATSGSGSRRERTGPVSTGRKRGGRHRAPRRRRRSRLLAILLGATSTALLVFAAPANGDEAGGSTATAQGRFAWPLAPPHTVARPFQPPADRYGPGHRGVDLAATPDQQVMAADTGVVVFAGTLAGRGVIAVDHDGGLRTTYEPVKPSVVVGDQVYQGQVLGTVVAGHEDCPVAACLHWGARRGDVYIDPLPLLAEGGEIRLKPWNALA